MSIHPDHGGGKPPHDTPLPAGSEERGRGRDQQQEKEHVHHEALALGAEPPPWVPAQGPWYVPTLGTMTPCGNGDFETGLDPAEWQGGYGTVKTITPTSLGPLVAGLHPGGIYDWPDGVFDQTNQAHQTWISAAATPTDPITHIPTTAPGSSGSVRIGNAVKGCGMELLSKTFLVTPASRTITFWYAVVLENPADHDPYPKPFFWVRVTDKSGAVIPNAFSFGGGAGDKLEARTDPYFFKEIPDPFDDHKTGVIVYKDWSCAQIDLSSVEIGEQVTIEFITGDCDAGGHWAYAYIDRFCGDCRRSPTGDISFNPGASTRCGPGQLCFDYTLPQAEGTTGTVTIGLDVYQNGQLLAHDTSPVLASGTSWCFAVDPAAIPGIDPSLGGFDFVATGDFAMGGASINTLMVGARPGGVTDTANDDYRIACEESSCAEIRKEQDAALARRCAARVNMLRRTSCRPQEGAEAGHPGEEGDEGDAGRCDCRCEPAAFPELRPCISVAWGDSPCDCLESDDVEVLCVTVCNCYSNVTFNDLSIGRVRVTDAAGQPVPALPDGTPSVRVVPSAPLCFGSVGPCTEGNRPGCVSRELVLHTRGAVGKEYRLTFEGVCFTVCHAYQSEQCFVLPLCED